MQFTLSVGISRCVCRAIFPAFFMKISLPPLFTARRVVGRKGESTRVGKRERETDRSKRLYLLPVCRFAILISTGTQHRTACNYGHLKASATCTLVCKQFRTRPGCPVSRINGLTFNYHSARPTAVRHSPPPLFFRRLI